MYEVSEPCLEASSSNNTTGGLSTNSNFSADSGRTLDIHTRYSHTLECYCSINFHNQYFVKIAFYLYHWDPNGKGEFHI